jgi:hypothetical protein
VPGLTEKVPEKVPEPSPTPCSSSCGSHGVDEKDPATKTGGIVPGLVYVMVNVEGGMAAEGKHGVSHCLLSNEGDENR